MLLSLLMAASVVITPTTRSDGERHTVGADLTVYRTAGSLWSAGLFADHSSATTVWNAQKFTGSFSPSIRTGGITVAYDLTGRPYGKDRTFGWFRRSGHSKFTMQVALRAGARQFRYDLPADYPDPHRSFVRDQEVTQFFATPLLRSRIFLARPVALDTWVGWEFGNSWKGYKGLQSSLGLSFQF